jgi:hypothetical protein
MHLGSDAQISRVMAMMKVAKSNETFLLVPLWTLSPDADKFLLAHFTNVDLLSTKIANGRVAEIQLQAGTKCIASSKP